MNFALRTFSQRCALGNAVEGRIWRHREVSHNSVEILFLVDFMFRWHLKRCPNCRGFRITSDALPRENQICCSYTPVGTIEDEPPTGACVEPNIRP